MIQITNLKKVHEKIPTEYFELVLKIIKKSSMQNISKENGEKQVDPNYGDDELRKITQTIS